MAGGHDVSQGRSPRYPRFPLLTAVGYAKRLYEGAHRSATDTLTAYRVMGFAGKSGASATALGAARQYGLVESTKGGVRVSDLALQILEPSSGEEYVQALHIAANLPQVFAQINAHFEELPRSDEPLRSYLIRALDFSKSGADDCIASLRETMSQLTDVGIVPSAPLPQAGEATPEPLESRALSSSQIGSQHGDNLQAPGATMRLPLTRECSAELRFSGPVSVGALERLIKHIELMKEVWDSEI